jgi:hypothetical protein
MTLQARVTQPIHRETVSAAGSIPDEQRGRIDRATWHARLAGTHGQIAPTASPERPRPATSTST